VPVSVRVPLLFATQHVMARDWLWHAYASQPVRTSTAGKAVLATIVWKYECMLGLATILLGQTVLNGRDMAGWGFRLNTSLEDEVLNNVMRVSARKLQPRT
jgi:hypothetical protein